MRLISILGFWAQRPPSSRRGLARARSLGRATFGFAKFLSSFPKRLKSPLGEGESFSVQISIHCQRCLQDQHTNVGEMSTDMSSPGGEETGEGERKTQTSFTQQFPHAQRLGYTPRLCITTALGVGRVAIQNFRDLAETALVHQLFQAAEICLCRRHRLR